MDYGFRLLGHPINYFGEIQVRKTTPIAGAVAAVIFFVLAVSADQTKQLDEIQKIKAENFKLRSQLLQCQVSVSNTELSKQQSQLVEEFRKELGATNEEVFDWNTLSFTHTTSK